MQIRFIISLIFSIIVALFAILNSSNVVVNFLFAKYTISQALVILISAILGAVIVMLLGTIKQVKLNLKVRSLSKTVEKLEVENKALNEKVAALEVEKEIDIEEINTYKEDNTIETNTVSSDVIEDDTPKL